MSKKNATASGTCKKTRRVMLGTVRVGNGEHLHYFITTDASTPIFSLSCKHKTHFNAKTLGVAKKKYEVIWPRTSADEEPAQDGEAYSFSMSFASALKYTLRLELHDSNHQPAGDGLIIDADYESDNISALCNEAFIVRTK